MKREAETSRLQFAIPSLTATTVAAYGAKSMSATRKVNAGVGGHESVRHFSQAFFAHVVKNSKRGQVHICSWLSGTRPPEARL
ncbi:MAG: hypothetical protein ABSC19_00915 [Syntrophorhabdales bacterium]|jgi:hypothetical protein